MLYHRGAALGVLAGLLAGCHVLVGHRAAPAEDRGVAPADARTDAPTDAAGDVPLADGSPPRDGSRDKARDAPRSIDQKLPDLKFLVPDALACAAPDLSGCCTEAEPLTNPQCAGSVSCSALDDCDGLPSARDPWPAQCNKVLLAEPFLDPSCPLFGRSYCDSSIKVVCGELRIVAAKNFTMMAWLKKSAGVSIPPAAPVEVRLRLNPVALPSSLEVVIAPTAPTDSCFPFGWTPANHRACILTFSASPMLVSRVGGNQSSGVAVATSAEIVIQSAVEQGLHRCRIFDANGALASQTHPFPSTYPSAATVAIYLTSPQYTPADLAVDWVRVFAPP